MRWLDPREVHLARRERGEFGARFVHHHDDEPLQPRRAPERGGGRRVRGEHPAAARAVWYEGGRALSGPEVGPRRLPPTGGGGGGGPAGPPGRGGRGAGRGT